MAKICDAIEESILDRFIIISKRGTKIEGQIKYVRDGKIFVEIDIARACRVPDLQYDRFNIYFKLNSLPIKMQFDAVRFMKDDGLFSQLINNPEYNKAPSHEDSLVTTKTTTNT